jgi:hypothetical protein
MEPLMARKKKRQGAAQPTSAKRHRRKRRKSPTPTISIPPNAVPQAGTAPKDISFLSGGLDMGAEVSAAQHRRRSAAIAAMSSGTTAVPLPPGQQSFATPPAPVQVSGGLQVQAPPTPLVAASLEVGKDTIESKLAERPADIRDLARALSREFTAQVEELKRSPPNEPGRLDQYDALVAFFEKMAAGLSNLADALDRAVTAEGKPEPAFLGRAAEVARQLQLGAMEWLEQNRMTVIEVPFRIGLFGLGVAFVHALGVDSNFVTTLIAGLSLRRAPKRQSQHKSRRK